MDKQEILNKHLHKHGLNSSFELTKEAIFDAMEEYANTKTTTVRYISKQVLVQAQQWHQNEPWVEGMKSCNCGDNEGCTLCGNPYVETREGPQQVFDGWYVVQTADGNYNTYSPKEFNGMYESV